MSLLSANELKDIAYNKVKEMILTHKLKPGEKIVQDKLASDLGISRTPLRGALQILESEYLVESLPRKGVIVARVSNQKIVDIYDCRIALESMAVRTLTETISKTDLNKLKKFFSSYRDGTKKISIKSYQNEDIKFHDFLINKCGNEFLKRLFHQGNLLISISQIGLIRPPEETLAEHFSIIDAISEGSIDKAEQLIREHLEISKQLVIEKLEAEK